MHGNFGVRSQETKVGGTVWEEGGQKEPIPWQPGLYAEIPSHKKKN